MHSQALYTDGTGEIIVKFLYKDRWPPYLVGALIGVLLSALFVAGYQIGVSSGISRVSALVERVVVPSHVTPDSYFARLLLNPVIFDWKILFVVGLFLGAWLASWLSNEAVPPKNTLWIQRFGRSKIKRYIGAFVGGFLVLLGARLADGCTSGHAISGGAQLSVVSWIFMGVLFVTAIPVSHIIYRKNR